MPGSPTPPPKPSYQWQSGDFVKPPRTQPPYNGVEIQAVPTYNNQKALVSLAITVTDFAKSKTGATQNHIFEPVQNGEKTTLSPSGDFTVQGPLELRLMPASPTDVVVFVNISYGLPDQTHHAEGGILEVPLLGTPGQAAGGDGDSDPSPKGETQVDASKGRRAKTKTAASKAKK